MEELSIPERLEALEDAVFKPQPSLLLRLSSVIVWAIVSLISLASIAGLVGLGILIFKILFLAATT